MIDMEENYKAMTFSNIYTVTLKSNCYVNGYKVKVAAQDCEEAIEKAKRHLEEDRDNFSIKVESAVKYAENVLI